VERREFLAFPVALWSIAALPASEMNNWMQKPADSRPSGVKALVFDVFGTVVDWRGSIIREGTQWRGKGLQVDWESS
jgi:hypothetical protein